MIEKIIEASIRNRFLVLILAAALTVAGVFAMYHTPVDAIPDLSENQVIVFTDWMGRSPREIEDQVTYPLSLKLKGLAGVRAVRSSSEFNFSMITLIFDDAIDFYFARQRVTEKLTQASTFLPPGVVPYMAPDATALGQIFWYTVEAGASHPVDSGRLWALNKFYIAPQLNAAAGVADVAVVGGTPPEYQIDVRPEALRAYGVTLGELYSAVAQSNMPGGGGVVQKNNAEYIVRGVGWIKDKQDIENTVIKEVQGTPIYVKTIGTVQLGTQFRRSVYEKDGNEVTGGVVLMRHEENPLAVTDRVKAKIQEIQPGLPEGVHIVPAYDRTRLIHGAIHTLREVMWHEMLIASIAILLILSHLRSVFVICVTLPLAVLFSFLTMWLLRAFGVIDIQANIMSLAGITISIGILVDQAIVMVENATHALKEHFGDRKVTGDIRELVIPACRTVGRPIFFSVMIMLITFIPVFMLSGREGKYFHPLAFTKSFALLGVALISITLVPALIPTFIKGRLRSEEENWIVRSFINIYKPLLTWALPRRNLVMWMFAALLILASGMFPLQAIIGQGASEIAWRQTFLAVFALVTSLTVISITGKSGPDFKAFVGDCGLALLSLALMALAGGIVGAGNLVGAKFGAFIVPLWLVGSVNLVTVLKWLIIASACVPLSALFFVAFRTRRLVLWRTITLVSLIVIGLWSYHFPKIGVAFMPALDEGTTLDMPITVPRASVTQSADDLKARDALLRGFPEVESVIGKAGRADTPTDPAPLDMVETFVNFRPKELWPKRVLKFEDARAQVEVALKTLEDQGYLAPISGDDRNNLVNDATQKALERFDEELRELALLRYEEFKEGLGSVLTRHAVGETARRSRVAGELEWPAGADETVELDGIAQKLSPQYGPWLAGNPALEDVAQLSQDVGRELKERGAVEDVVGALELKESFLGKLVSDVSEVLGGEHRIFAGELLKAVERERSDLWRDRVKHVNWELFDQGVKAYCWYVLEELAKASQQGGHSSGAPRRAAVEQFAAAALQTQLGKRPDRAALEPFLALTDQLTADFEKRVFFWPRQTGPKGDLVDDEMGRVLQVPGWSNIFTQPIINRIEMLSTGVRTDIGVKVFGPDLDTIDRVCKQVEAALKPLNGARDVVAAPFMGKGYLQIDIDREKAARYGISVEDIENEIEVALAGKAITYTVENRDRFPVRIRYARVEREDEESVRRLLVSGGGMAADGGQRTARMAEGGGDGESGVTSVATTNQGHATTPGHAARGKPLIPLSALADVQVVDGPAMIKSENSQLLNYVTLMVRGRDIVGFVDEAQRVVAEKVKLPQGVHIEWSGEFEHQVRAAKTLRFVFPVVIVLIFVILYLTYNDFMDAVLMMLAVPEALAGGAFFMYLFPKIVQGWSTPPMDFSVAVWVGFIACFGMATETGIIMLVYLREAIEKRGGLEKIASLEELRQAVIEGAVHRLRPKLLTEGVAIIAIFPMVFAKGVGGEILAPMALPVLGGLLISDEVVDLFLPVRFYWVRRARWLKLHGHKPRPEIEPRPEPVDAVGHVGN
ncbi:MAG TPA: efflux RND transporter permease subunit [Pirellulales bacterium]|nr:efflux RND transporter permease subunit [Pirellulales bacterium]